MNDIKRNFRSLLYVPASRQDFIAKAHTRGADAIILDLEDSVASAEKSQARGELKQSISLVRKNGATVFVRINSQSNHQHLDIEAAFLGNAFGLYVPKANVEQLQTIDTFLTKLEASHKRQSKMNLVALIEDPAGVLDARKIAKCPRVMALSVGGEDLANALGAQPIPDALQHPKLMVHYAAKAEGLLSFGLLQSVVDFNDTASMRAAAQRAKQHGFDGSTCVHPMVVPVLNAEFSPSREEIEWAQGVIIAARESSFGAFELDGKMVDAPIISRAELIVNTLK